MSLSDRIFEEMGEFAITVQYLAKAGWSFKTDNEGDRCTIIVTKGKREERCHDTGEIDKLINIREGVFDETWEALPNADAIRGYDDGFYDCKYGWKRGEDHLWCCNKYKEGYLKGWDDADEAGLFPKGNWYS